MRATFHIKFSDRGSYWHLKKFVQQPVKLFHELRIKKVNLQGMMGEAMPNLVTAHSTLGEVGVA